MYELVLINQDIDTHLLGEGKNPLMGEAKGLQQGLHNAFNLAVYSYLHALKMTILRQI